MNEITIPSHLAIPTIICILGLGTIIFFRQRLFSNYKIFWTSVTVFLSIYLLIVGSALYDDIFYQWDLNQYDINKDGLFDEQEMTDDQKDAMNRLISDTGRNFSFITGFIFAGAVSIMMYILGRLKLFITKRRQ